jgi:hypothetical protein
VNIAKENGPGFSPLSPALDALHRAREVCGIDWNPKDTHDRPAGFADQNSRRHMNLLLNYAAHGFMLDVSKTSKN